MASEVIVKSSHECKTSCVSPSVREVLKITQRSDLVKYLEGDSLVRLQLRIEKETIQFFKDAMRKKLDHLLSNKSKGVWDCADTGALLDLLYPSNLDLWKCITLYCNIELPHARTCENDGILRIRFHPRGSIGMSINSWKQIHLIRYSRIYDPSSSQCEDFQLTCDLDLGYMDQRDTQNFDNVDDICREISRVYAIVSKRRKEVTTSRSLADLFVLIDNAPCFKNASVWTLNDQGINIELECGTHAHISILTAVSKKDADLSTKDNIVDRKSTFSGVRVDLKAKPRKKRSSRRPTEKLDDSRHELRVSTFDRYHLEYFGGTVTWDPVIAFEYLREWQSAYEIRGVLRTRLFKPLFGHARRLDIPNLSDNLTIVCLGPPRGSTEKDSDRVCLLSVTNKDDKSPMLYLWTLIMTSPNGKCAFIMSERRDLDDGDCIPDKSNVNLTFEISPSDDESTVVAGLKSHLERLYTNYHRARSLMSTIITRNITNGLWILYDPNKQGYNPTKQGERPIETVTSSAMAITPIMIARYSWEKIYLYSPSNTLIVATFDVDNWGLKLPRFPDGEEEKKQRLAKTPEEVIQMLKEHDLARALKIEELVHQQQEKVEMDRRTPVAPQ